MLLISNLRPLQVMATLYIPFIVWSLPVLDPSFIQSCWCHIHDGYPESRKPGSGPAVAVHIASPVVNRSLT